MAEQFGDAHEPTPPTAPGPVPGVTGPEFAEPMGPVTEPDRILALDVLRGFAIFGIFMVNIAFFAMPMGKIMDFGALAEASEGERLAAACVKALFEYKFVSTFSLLFGMGMIVQMMRSEAKGKSFVPMYLRRTLVLMLFGLIHGVLLWYGDILFIYSWVALIVMWMRRLSARLMLLLSAIALTLSMLFMGANLALGVVFGGMGVQPMNQADTDTTGEEAADDEATPAGGVSDSSAAAGETGVEAGAGGAAPAEVVPDETSPDEAGAGRAVDDEASAEGAAPEPEEGFMRFWNQLMADFNNPEEQFWTTAEVIAYREGPMSAAIVMRAFEFAGMLVFAGIFSGFGLRVICMFLLGAALMKLDFFAAHRRRWHVQMCTWGLLFGLIGEVSVVLIYKSVNYQFGWTIAGAELLHQVASLVLCLGYVGAMTLLAHVGAVRWLMHGFAAVGRMALTNYLMETLIATFIMYWWGLALFNQVSRPEQLGLVLIIYPCLMVASVLWLRLFRMGPIEWLWRALTYWRTPRLLR